jgi:PAS domain S-box-containing protein
MLCRAEANFGGVSQRPDHINICKYVRLQIISLLGGGESVCLLFSSDWGGLLAKDKYKTKAQLISELEESRRRLAQLEAGGARPPDDPAPLGINWRSLVENSPDHIMILDSKGAIVYLNHAAPGLSRDKVIGTSVFDYFPQEFAPEVEACLARVKQTQKPHSYSTAFGNPDGSTSFFESLVAPVIQSGEVVAFNVRSSDTTARNEAEAAMRLTQFSVDTASVNIFWITPEGRFIYVNDSTCRDLGYSRGELLEMGIADVDPGFKPRQRRAQWESFKQNQVMTLEAAHRRKNGTTFPVEVLSHYLEFEGREYEFAFVTNISRRKQAQRERAQSEERFAKMFKASPLWVSLSTLEDGTYLDVNDAFSKITGYSRQEVMGKTSTETGLWPDPARRRAAVEQIERLGSLRDFHIDYRTKSGEIRHALWSAERLQLQGQDCMISVLRDITDRIKAQEALKKSEEKFSKVFKSSPNIVTIATRDEGHFLEVNDAFSAVTGYSRQEALGRTSHEMNFWVDIQQRQPAMEIIDREGSLKNFPIDIRHKSGRVIHVLWSAELIDIEEQTCLISVFNDVTEQVLSQQALAESEARYRGLFDNMLSSFAYHRIVTDGQGRPVDYVFLEVNQAFERTTGLKAADILGKPVSEVLPGIRETEFDWIGTYGQVALSGRPVHFEQHFAPHGKWYSITAYCPEPGHFAAIFADITERKEAELALMARARQQAAVAELGQLALTEPDLTSLMDRAMVLLQTALEVDLCKVLQLLPSGDSLLLTSGIGWRDGLVGQATVSAGKDSQAGYTLFSTKPVIVEVLGEETRFSGPQLLLDHGVVSGLSVIIGDQNSPFGVLGVHTSKPRKFTGQDVNVVQSVANILAAAIERHQGGEALKASEERFRDLAQLLPEIIFETDLQGKLVFVNQAAFDQMGYSRKDFEGDPTALDMIIPEDRDRVAQNIKRSLSGKSPELHEYTAQRKDGSTFPCLVSSTAIIQDGKPVGLRGFVIDISERKQAEQALAQSEARYRELFTNMSSGVALYEAVEGGQDFVFKELNRAGEKITQSSKERVLGKKVSEVFPGVKELGLFEVLQRVWRTGRPEHHPTAIYQDQHLNLWVENYICKLPSGEIVTIFDDITKRKQAEDSLQWELFVNTALATISNAMISNQADVDSVASLVLSYAKQLTGSEHGYVSSFDPQTGDTADHTITRMMGDPCKVEPREQGISFPVGPDGAYPSLWGHALNTLESFFTNTPADHPRARGLPRGHVPLTNFLSVPVIFAGKAVGQIALARAPRDYTDRDLGAVEQLAELFALSLHRKGAEEEHDRLQAHLRQTQKMEAIGTLAGGIAHDFNNVLAAIMGFTELTLVDLPMDTEAHGNLEQVLKAANRAKDLVSQILSFSRRGDQEKKPVEIGPIIKEALKLLRASLPATIEIQTRLHVERGKVLANPVQIHQLIMNLCTNAAQAMPGGGLLRVEISAVEMGRRETARYAGLVPGRYLLLRVSDTGVGMESQVMERIFEPFFTTKEPGEGTGMGLSVVHGLVKSHGGAITVYSEPGQGSSFSVHLPSIEASGDDGPGKPDAPLPGGNERVLLIDDEPALADIGRHALERLGYRVRALTSGPEALELFTGHPDDFDLVITDYTMPQITGLDLARELQKIRPDIPIIMCTGFSGQLTAQRAQEAGIKRLLVKPLVRRDTALAVRQVLDDAASNRD